jgi:hypothetical protein
VKRDGSTTTTLSIFRTMATEICAWGDRIYLSSLRCLYGELDDALAMRGRLRCVRGLNSAGGLEPGNR